MNAYQFFLRHAGYSYDPKTQTSMQGRIQYARQLADAERKARNESFSYRWTVDDIYSNEFSDESPAWQLWSCSMYNADGQLVNSLGGVDFGHDGNPWSDPYRRVVEAELAIDGLTNYPQ